MPHIMVYGNPSDGFRFVGPFDTKRKALDYCAHEPGNAWVAELDAPSPLLGDLDGFERLAKSVESIPTSGPKPTAVEDYAAWLARQPKPKTMAEALAQLPTGVEVFGICDPAVMHSAIAEAVGERGLTEHDAMLAIQELLDGVEWTSDTLGRIAEIMAYAGYRIADSDITGMMEG